MIGDPYNYEGPDVRTALSIIGRALNAPTPEFLARAYTSQELSDALAIRIERDRSKLALNAVYGEIARSKAESFTRRNHTI